MELPGSQVPFASHGDGCGQQSGAPASHPHDIGSFMHSSSLHASGSVGSLHGGAQPGSVGSVQPPPVPPPPQLPFASHLQYGSVVGSHGGGQFGSLGSQPGHGGQLGSPGSQPGGGGGHAGSVVGSHGSGLQFGS